jgi:hypothetical protein
MTWGGWLFASLSVGFVLTWPFFVSWECFDRPRGRRQGLTLMCQFDARLTRCGQECLGRQGGAQAFRRRPRAEPQAHTG